MSRAAHPIGRSGVSLSILDRLRDEPAPASRAEALRRLKRSVADDLEMLLNTRRVRELPEGLKELNNSVAAYGMPDFSTLNARSSADRNHLVNVIEGLIARFEPRLREVFVSVEPSDDEELEEALRTERALHFRIDAQLIVEPTAEPVTFDTTLRLNSGDYQVHGDG
ncbi:MAG TPA: type VI secretion system baseplate subunit TssE [Pyrinomonadaceae bacterium]|nr:type VI secretion system baseplate subunit TssE [Pyrinomonadaceae bacterium]